MKKSFFSMMLTITAVALGVLTVTVSAAEPKTEASSARLEEAKSYALECAISGSKVGFKLGGMPIPAEKDQMMRQAITEWFDKYYIPFLQANGILDEWVAMQLSPKVREFNTRCQAAKSVDEFIEIAKASNAYTAVNYPKTHAAFKSPAYQKIMLKLQSAMTQVIAE